jgi:hypothetical protein
VSNSLVTTVRALRNAAWQGLLAAPSCAPDLLPHTEGFGGVKLMDRSSMLASVFAIAPALGG